MGVLCDFCLLCDLGLLCAYAYIRQGFLFADDDDGEHRANIMYNSMVEESPPISYNPRMKMPPKVKVPCLCCGKNTLDMVDAYELTHHEDNSAEPMDMGVGESDSDSSSEGGED